MDDCLYALQATIPHLTRSSLHRCLKRHHAISRLPEIAGDKVANFKRYPIGYFHLDIAEVRTEEGKLYLFVAIDRTSKFVFAQLHEAANVKSAVGFLQALIHIVLTDNGIQFGDMPSRRTGPTARCAGCTCSTPIPAASMVSSTASPNRTIPGPTVRSSG